MSKKHKRNFRKNISSVLILSMIVVVLGAMFAVWTSDYYRAEPSAAASIVSDYEEQVVKNQNYVAIVPKNLEAKKGIIFYPGAKVDYLAYAPLMRELCAKTDVVCILAKMPFNLALLDMFIADDVVAYYPFVEEWYVAGHSLGGIAASVYAAHGQAEVKGLALLGSYSMNDFSDSDLKVLSVYGDQDLILTMEQYETSKEKLPEGFKEYIIEGGNHAGFGVYGVQKGDGTATVSGEEQRRITVEALAELMDVPLQEEATE